MYRNVYESLCAWKRKKDRKPLVLSGARQVGKTWILKEFGNAEYECKFRSDGTLIPLTAA